MDHPQIYARAFNAPLMVDARKAQAFVAGLGPRLLGRVPELAGGAEGGDDAVAEAALRPVRPFASLLDASLADSIRAGERQGYALKGGVAVIPIAGVLVHRGAWIGRSSGQVSYEGIAAQIETAAEDSRVRAIALEIDSFGGEVAGCFGLAQLIREVGAAKPVRAFVAEHAYSAGYALASQAGQVILPATGGVGSIGVICLHADYSGALEAGGVKVTIVAAGAHKADGNPYEPLPEAVRDTLGAEMERLRGMFVDTVAAGRGARLDAAAARATEARSYMGAAAVAAGLADAVADPRRAFDAFVAEVDGRAAGAPPARAETRQQAKPKTQRRAAMADETDDVTEPETEESGTDPQPAATPAAAAPKPAPVAAPAAAGGERARIAAILTGPEAEGREALARHLAFETDLDPTACAGILKAAAKSADAGSLAAAMAGDDSGLDLPAAEGGRGPRAVDAVKRRNAGR